MNTIKISVRLLTLLLLPISARAEALGEMDLTTSWVGYTALILFVLAYAMVVMEEFTHLRKSKPVILAAGIIWALVALVYAREGINHAADEGSNHRR